MQLQPPSTWTDTHYYAGSGDYWSRYYRYEYDNGKCDGVYLGWVNGGLVVNYFIRSIYLSYQVPFDSPELAALARHSTDPLPVVDWLVENAVTTEQRRLAALLEAAVAAEYTAVGGDRDQ